MALTVAQLTTARNELALNRASGTRQYRDASGELVEYKTDREMASALAWLDAEIAKA